MKTWMEIIFRSIGILAICFVGVKVMGKRQISKTTPFIFVTYIVIAILGAMISANMISDLRMGFTSLAVWIVIPLAMEYLSLRSKRFYDFYHGKETIVVKSGKIMNDNLKRIRITGDELLSELKNKKVYNLADVEFAIMEPTGEMNIIFKSREPKRLVDMLEPKVKK